MSKLSDEEKQLVLDQVAAGRLNRSSHIDITLVLEQLPAATPEAADHFGKSPADAFTIAPALVQPTSRGTVRLASSNFQDAAGGGRAAKRILGSREG